MDTTLDSVSSPRLIVTIDNAEMLNKVKNAIKMLRGVTSIEVFKPQKNEIDLALDDVKTGKVTRWNSVDEMFKTILDK